MNIHFNDKELFKKLQKATLFKGIVGSKMYGTDDLNSDTDYLYIYVPSINQRNTFNKSHHQLQYKEERIDHNFVDVFTFINNIVKGDSTISFELISHESIIDSPLGFLYDMKHAFYNYKIIKSYNGMAIRDSKFLQRNDYNQRALEKRLFHIFRGHEFSEMILNKEFNPVIAGTSLMDKFEDFKIDYCETNIIQFVDEVLKPFRAKINEIKDNDPEFFPEFMRVEDQNLLDKKLNELIYSNIWIKKQNWNMRLNMFYEVNENIEIKY